MKPTEVLMQEHRVIERVLDALETAADRLNRGRPVRPAFFLEAADFIAGFADGCHHRKEEDVLFGAMTASGALPDDSPIDMMLDEHEQGRAFTRALRAAARGLETGAAGAQREIVANAKGYVALLRDHIMKEDEMLFPMADELLSEAQQEEMGRTFARMERDEALAGSHEQFLALAERLEREASAA